MRNLFLGLILLTNWLLAQGLYRVDVKAVGANRALALEGAKRMALMQALSAAVPEMTTEKNFRLVQDAISSEAARYQGTYRVVDERRHHGQYEVSVSAEIETRRLRDDARNLDDFLEDFRIVVSSEGMTSGKSADSAYSSRIHERVMAFLVQEKIDFVGSDSLERMAKDDRTYLPETTAGFERVEALAISARVPLVLAIGPLRVCATDAPHPDSGSVEVIVGMSAIYSYTGESIAAVACTSKLDARHSSPDVVGSLVDSLTSSACDMLLREADTRIGNWLWNGRGYLIRFYGLRSLAALQVLSESLKTDPRFARGVRFNSCPEGMLMGATFEGWADGVFDAITECLARTQVLRDLVPLGFAMGTLNFCLRGVPPPESARGVIPVDLRK